MVTQNSIRDKYGEVLRAYIEQPAEKHLVTAADIGWELITRDVPIENVAETHQQALDELLVDVSDGQAREIVGRAWAPLMEMLMAYSLALRGWVEEHERVVRGEEQLKAARQIEAKNVELESLNKKLKETMADSLVAQRRLMQSEKLAALGSLVAGVGHELNNPIMGILNYVEYCADHTDEDDPRHSRLTKAVRELERCQGTGTLQTDHIRSGVLLARFWGCGCPHE